MAKYQKTKNYNNTILQTVGMKKYYPQFVSNVKPNGDIEFVGVLNVDEGLPSYKVSVTYRKDKSPQARVLKPALVAKPPHFYSESGTLCLYHPRDYVWNKNKLIAKEIIPWVASWIYFYEVWLEHGKWYGPEAEHITLKPNKHD